MFVELANALAGTLGGADAAANAVLQTNRPSQIVDFLEDFWRQGIASPALFLGNQVIVGDLQDQARTNVIDPPSIATAGTVTTVVDELCGYHHLVYAFMLENTRMYDIFRRVVFEYAHGERLPNASQATARWLRNTEELFFGSQRGLSIRGITSNLRPDDTANRRNLYFRALGMDLSHGMDDGRAYPYVKADTANRDFVVLFEALLSEVWKGYTNRMAFVSSNDTDNNAILTIVRRLEEMLQARRYGGRLSREEFDAVATLSWFHLTVAANTQVVNNLSAQAAGQADRLKRIGELVGLSAHARADAYFELAQPMSAILRGIESGAVRAAGPAGLYNGIYQAAMLNIITHWSIATGRDLKDPSRRQVMLPTLTGTSRGTASIPSPASRIPAGILR